MSTEHSEIQKLWTHKMMNSQNYHCEINEQNTSWKIDEVQINNQTKFISMNSLKTLKINKSRTLADKLTFNAGCNSIFNPWDLTIWNKTIC